MTRCRVNPFNNDCNECARADAERERLTLDVNPRTWDLPCDCQCQRVDGTCGGCAHRSCGKRTRRRVPT